MKELTQEYLQSIMFYNRETGEFRWRHREGMNATWNTKYSGKLTGWNHSNGYKQTCIDRKKYFLHRLAWFYIYGRWPIEIDHIDRDKANNRISNLREVAHKQNCQNRKQRSNPNGYKGVTYSKRDNVWYARITRDGVSRHLGTFLTSEAAYSAYCKAAA